MSDPEAPADLPSYVTDPLRRQDLARLRAIRAYVDALIDARETAADRTLTEADVADDTEEVIDVAETTHGTRVVKKVPCGKDGCSSCPHGPYEYRVRREGESLDWEYVGAVDE